MNRQQGLSFCEVELDMIKQEAIGLYDFLETRFSDLRVVYSGRGYPPACFRPKSVYLNN